jgi:anti-sigma regulatory factor (Ser/Thr protein kinase)
VSNILTKTITNKISELPNMADAVNSFLVCKEVATETINSVHLILDELLSNVILWGYEDYQEHLISVKVAVDHTQVQVVIEDDGRNFDPTSAPTPDVLLKPEHRSEGGLGIHLVRSMAEKVTHNYVNGRNIMEINLTRA